MMQLCKLSTHSADKDTMIMGCMKSQEECIRYMSCGKRKEIIMGRMLNSDLLNTTVDKENQVGRRDLVELMLLNHEDRSKVHMVRTE